MVSTHPRRCKSTRSNRDGVPAGGAKLDKDKCPACDSGKEGTDKEVWMNCDQCKTWYHWFCTESSAEHVISSIKTWCVLRAVS